MQKISVTIGIPAYNEEANIASLLTALTRQKERNIEIREILVYSDGSTDKTVANARSVKDSRIRVIADKVQRSKVYRLNQIFDAMKGDVLVLFDADTRPDSSNTVERLCEPFQNPAFQGLTAANRRTVTSQTLTGIALGHLNEAYRIVRRELNNGKNIYSFLAGGTALHKKLVQAIRFPLGSNADDNYVFLTAKKKGFPIQYIDQAGVWFATPQSAQDQILQGSRFLSSRSVLERHFDAAFIQQEFSIPLSLQLKVFFYQILRNPVAYIWLKCLGIVCQMNSAKIAPTMGATWKISTSTKKAL